MTKSNLLPDYVRISTFLFIEEYEAKVGQVRGVVFNKFMTLLNYDLKATKNIDIRLPHCWYRWGDEVVKYYLRTYTKWDHEDLGITTVAWKGGVPEDYRVNDPTVAEIRKNIKKYIEEYSDDDGWERAIDRLYSIAPYEFQNEFRKLRENLKGAVSGNYIHGYLTKFLTPLFNNAMRTFPKEFSEINEEKIYFESIFKASVENEAPIEDIRNLAEEFWFFFCYYLRLDEKCHENISTETLNVWESSLQWERELYNRSLQDLAFDLKLEGKNKNIDLLLKTRSDRIEEFNELLDEYRSTDDINSA